LDKNILSQSQGGLFELIAPFVVGLDVFELDYTDSESPD
jgi:hypothetical protein